MPGYCEQKAGEGQAVHWLGLYNINVICERIHTPPEQCLYETMIELVEINFFTWVLVFIIVIVNWARYGGIC